MTISDDQPDIDTLAPRRWAPQARGSSYAHHPCEVATRRPHGPTRHIFPPHHLPEPQQPLSRKDRP